MLSRETGSDLISLSNGGESAFKCVVCGLGVPILLQCGEET